MRQDNETCANCGKLCGDDEGKATWFGEKKEFYNTAICGECIEELLEQFCGFFNVEPSYTKCGIEIYWHEMYKILSLIKINPLKRSSYIEVDDMEKHSNYHQYLEQGNDD